MFYNESQLLDELGASVTLEYVKDSPMFRQNITVFEDSFLQLNVFCSNVMTALNELESAFVGLEAAQSKVVRALTKQSGTVSRSLFTNALPQLTELSHTLQTMSCVLNQTNKSYQHIRTQIRDRVQPLFDCLSKENMSTEKALHQRMIANYGIYENLMCQSLQSRNPLSETQQEAILNARKDYELDRYDLVERLNCLDCNKKIIISKAVQALFAAYESSGCYAFALEPNNVSSALDDNNSNNSSKSNNDEPSSAAVTSPKAQSPISPKSASASASASASIAGSPSPSSPAANHATSMLQTFHQAPEYFRRIDGEVNIALSIMRSNADHWRTFRQKLAGEIFGCLPPPGSPPGALSPVQARPYRGMPLHSINLTTEVLSKRTREANYDDVRHARDDGVFKQGYLYVKAGGRFSKRKRKWHRLFSSKLYLIELLPNALTCTNELVCDVSRAEIVIEKSRKPFKFTILPGDKKRLVFQAENEDEQIKWVQALRRCTLNSSMPGRPLATAANAPIPMTRGSLHLTSNTLLLSSQYRGGAGVNPVVSSEVAANKEQEDYYDDEASDDEDRDVVTASPALADGIGREDSPSRSNAADVVDVVEAVGNKDTTVIDAQAEAEELANALAVQLEANELRKNFFSTLYHQEHAKSLVEFLVCNSTCADCDADCVRMCRSSQEAYVGCVKVEEYIFGSIFMLAGPMQLLLSELGNVNSNSIWEASVAEGWQKPSPTSTSETKQQWIIAKYQWYAFVKEFRVRSNEQLAEGIFSAAFNSDVSQIHFWLSHKADINCLYSNSALTGSNVAMTPLHAALKNCNINTLWFLLQNGADIYVPDSAGQSVLDIVTKDSEFGHPVVKQMFLQIQRLEY